MSNPDCEMPECSGESDKQTVAARDPSDNLIEICETCLNEGWGSVVEVIEQ